MEWAERGTRKLSFFGERSDMLLCRLFYSLFCVQHKAPALAGWNHSLGDHGASYNGKVMGAINPNHISETFRGANIKL